MSLVPDITVFDAGRMKEFPTVSTPENEGQSSNSFPTIAHRTSRGDPRIVMRKLPISFAVRLGGATGAEEIYASSALLRATNGVGPFKDRGFDKEIGMCIVSGVPLSDPPGFNDLRKTEDQSDMSGLSTTFVILPRADTSCIDAGRLVVQHHVGVRDAILEIVRTGRQVEIPVWLVANVHQASFSGKTGQAFVNGAQTYGFDSFLQRAKEGFLDGLLTEAHRMGLITPMQKELVRTNLKVHNMWVAVAQFYMLCGVMAMAEDPEVRET